MTTIDSPSPMTMPSAGPQAGVSTKIHSMVDGRGRPLVVLLGPGQGGDSPMFIPLMQALRVPRSGPGRPRTGLG